jgi:hypothetical protein
MSHQNALPIVRLDEAVGGYMPLWGRWFFSLQNINEGAKKALITKIRAAINENFGHRDSEGRLFAQALVVTKLGGFTLFPREILQPRITFAPKGSEVLILGQFLRELEVVLVEAGAKAKLLKALDLFASLGCGDHDHHSRCRILDKTTSRNKGEEHLASVRLAWQEYLASFLWESTQRSQIEAPDLLEEILLSYPSLDLLVTLDLFKKNLNAGSPNTVLFHPFLKNYYAPDEIEEALSRLIGKELLSQTSPISQIRNPKRPISYYQATVVPGPAAKYLQHHRLPTI